MSNAPHVDVRRPHVSWLVVLAVLVAGLASAPFVGGARSASNVSGLIAFTRPGGVYVMRTDGSDVRLLRRAGGAYVPGSVTWSPDGRKVAYMVETNLWVMNADGSHAVRLLDLSALPPASRPTWSLSRPTWSPDGRRIAFAATRMGGGGIWVVNADGSNLRRLTTRWAWAPDWSPDGRQIVSVGTAHGYGIYVMNVDGSNLHKLTPLSGGWVPDPGTPDWSPDGRRIVFVHAVPFLARNGVNVQPNDEIWIMDANGGSRVRLTHNHVSDHDPVWSPDGSKIAFVAAFAGAGSSEIYVINADGSGFTRLTHNHVTDGSPTWQPVAAPQA